MDTNILLWIHGAVPQTELVEAIFKTLTKFGSSAILLAIAVVITLVYTFSMKLNKAHIFLLTGIFAAIINSIIKQLAKRTRPILWTSPIEVDGYSFPSGHALIAIAVYGILAYFLGEKYPYRRKAIYSLSGIFIFLIGFSRLYLGVHWPSDILAGWLIGGLILYIMIWWYNHGGITRTVRVTIGVATLFLGIIGIIFPIIPGIPLIIVSILLIFSSKSLSELFSRKKTA